jgi:hypothetical protein
MSTTIIPGPNVFRAISGSLFSTAANWSRGIVPTGSDVAMIGDNCVIDINRTIGTLVVRPGFTASINTGLTFQINDIIDVKGHLSCSGNPTVLVASAKNNINSLSPGSSTFIYYRVGNQPVPGVTYNNLTISNIGPKILIGNTSLNGNLVNNSVFQLGSFDFVVTGTTSGNSGTLIKSGGGNVLFIGQIGAVVGNAAFIDFSMSTCNVECRGGIDLINGSTIKTSPTGTWSFTTNNQNIIFSGGNAGNIIFNGPVVIGNNISVSNYLGTFGFLNFYSTLNGSNSSSSLINRGAIILHNSTPVMTTGVFNITSFVNTLQLNFAGSMNLQFNNYYNLTINATGTKSAIGNISILGSLSVPIGGMELGIYNLVVDGNTICQSLTKSGSGSILFKGALQGSNGVIAAGGVVDFSVGNPLVECRGGIYLVNNGTDPIKTGTGTWTFTTNNQVIDWNAGSGGAMIFSCNVLISGAITLSLNRVVTFNQSVDGNNASSRLLVGTNTPTITYNAATRPMVTGLLDTSTNLNTWIYGNSNQDIKGGTYRNLTLNGGGTKTLQGNVSVQNTYTLTSPATLNNNGFTLTNP